MSLAHGLIGKQSVVMAADSYGHSNDPGGMYGYHFSKLMLVNQDRWILGIAGSDSSRSIPEELQRKQFTFDGQIDDAVLRYSKEIFSIRVERSYRGDCYFLLAAFDNGVPCFYEWHLLDSGSGQLSRRLSVQIAAIGARYHGALYFSHAYHRPDMGDEELALLAHFCVSEAANHDPRIGRPIDVGIVRSDGARLLAPEEIAAVEAASLEVASEIRGVFNGHVLKLPRL